MTPAFSDDLLSRLSGFATNHFGLRFPPDRWRELGRGIASAALELGISDMDGWAEHLLIAYPPEEHLNAIANHLTIPETYFFRHRETFTLLEKEIIPARLAKRRAQGRPLRFWSAGCASGEEPYSLALLLRHAFPELSADSFVIQGTDINTHVLRRATQGLYTEWSFRDSPEWVKPFGFTRKANNRYELNPSLRAAVRFSKLNLTAPLFPAEFGERADMDVVLCRNVLMYFSAQWQNTVIKRLSQAMAPGAWLIIGPCDISPQQAQDYDLTLKGAGVFQKSPTSKARLDFTAPFVPPPALLPAYLPEAPILDPGEIAPDVPAVSEIATPADASLPPVGDIPAAPIAVENGKADAWACANRGELDLALNACDASLIEDRTNPDFHYLRGCILQELERIPEAIASFNRVLFLNRDSVMAHLALATLASRQEDPETARHHYSLVLRILKSHNPGEAVPGSEGLTVGRLRSVVEKSLVESAG